MRTKNNNKRTALLKATLALVNERGFQAAPMSKIAKNADVSPATIYLFFKNKEDMINTLYVELKANLGINAFQEYKVGMPVKEGFELIWNNIARYRLKEPNESAFLTQCDNTPMINEKSRLEGTEHLRPLFDLWQRGQSEGIIKPLSLYLIYAYTLTPFSFLMQSQKRKKYSLNAENLKHAFEAGWDAIKVK